MRSAAFAALLFFAAFGAVSPATAQSVCAEPPMPAPVDGVSVTADQLRAANAEARNFISQSGVYQSCLTNEVEAAKSLAATEGRPFDPAIEADAKARIAASERAQEKVGLAINTAMSSYKQAH